MIRKTGKASTLGQQAVPMKVSSLTTFDTGTVSYTGQMAPTTKAIGLEVCKRAEANT